MNIPSLPFDKLTTTDGLMADIWRQFFEVLVNQLQQNVSDEGFVTPTQSISNINQLTDSESGTYVFDGTNNLPKVNINGVWKTLLTTTTPSNLITNWIEVKTSPQQIKVATGYITNDSSLILLNLPITANIGDQFAIAGIGPGGWKITQNAGQNISFGSLQTTVGVGGYISSTMNTDGAVLQCIIANTTFKVLSADGNLTVV